MRVCQCQHLRHSFVPQSAQLKQQVAQWHTSTWVYLTNKKKRKKIIHRYTRARGNVPTCQRAERLGKMETEKTRIAPHLEHYRDVRSACTACSKPVHLAYDPLSDRWTWQHDAVPTPWQVEKHRQSRGVTRDVPRELAEKMIREARS